MVENGFVEEYEETGESSNIKVEFMELVGSLFLKYSSKLFVVRFSILLIGRA